MQWYIIQLLKGQNMNETWKHYAKQKKLEIKGHILYNSIYMKYP